VKQRAGPVVMLVGQAMRDHRHEDVVQRGQVTEQVVVLEDEADRSTEHRRIADRKPPDVAPVDRDHSVVRPVQRSDQVKQSRFSRARRAHDSHHRAGFHVERDIDQSRHRRPALPIPP
jgi:hypothetical protein